MSVLGYMIGTVAVHTLGDISRRKGDLCYVHSETEVDYIGNWVTGLGFMNVRFPKVTTRPLTEEEVKIYNQKYVYLSGGVTSKLKVD